MKEMKCDVIVVAGGPAGLAAAVSAAENGADVILFEKSPTTGGAANMGMGPLGLETNLQKKRLIGITKEEAFKKFMTHTHWRVDARLVRKYFNKSSDTIHWLEDMGVEFFDVVKYFPGSEATWHIVKPDGGGVPGPRAASSMTRIMTQKAEELGVKILLETPVKKLIKENGKIAGVIAQDKAGEDIEARADAVIIATGGFGDNPEMIKDHFGYEWGKDFFSFRIPGLKGDGIRMAWEAGAGKSDMNMEIIFGVPGIQDSALTDFAFRQPRCLFVNILGERFMNEEIAEHTTYTGNAIVAQPKRCMFSIFDSKILKYYKRNGLDLNSLVHSHIDLSNFEEDLQTFIDQGNEFVFIADSIEELAEKTGIDADALKATLEEYNQGCEDKEDFFDKKNRNLVPIKGPKFFAAKFFPGAYGSLGGIRINSNTEVLDDDFKVIPGLYAAGTDACSIYGDSYVFDLPGNTMGFCLNTGRMAGENAAEYVNSIR
jgi:fumarate reductase flavoprotein subunit